MGNGFSETMRSVLPASGSRRGRRALGPVLGVVLAAVVLGGCSLFDKDLPLSDDPPDRLYNEGLYLLNSKHDFKAAAKKFEEVDRQHPYSEWARKSLIMSAYAYYESQQYDEAITSAKRYVTLHPGSPDASRTANTPPAPSGRSTSPRISLPARR